MRRAADSRLGEQQSLLLPGVYLQHRPDYSGMR